MTLEEEYARRHPRSAALHARAVASLPGGVPHDGRALAPFPVYIDRAGGARTWDVDGHEYLDLWGGAALHLAMLINGVDYSRGLSAGWLNAAMADADIDFIVAAFERSLERLGPEMP